MLYPDYHNKKLIAHEHAQQFQGFSFMHQISHYVVP